MLVTLLMGSACFTVCEVPKPFFNRLLHDKGNFLCDSETYDNNWWEIVTAWKVSKCGELPCLSEQLG